MKQRNDYESSLWKVLEKSHLGDLSQFHRAGFFEEVPFFSRYSDVAFLEDQRLDQVNRVLLRFALKFLRSLISYEYHNDSYFAAITVSDFSPGDPIVPNLFVWNRPVAELKTKLRLAHPWTPFGVKVKNLVAKIHESEHYEILQDTQADQDCPRVFIGPAASPYPEFVRIDSFATNGQSSAALKKTKTRKKTST